MTTMEALALKGTALRIQLRAAEKAFEELFVAPVKNWLEGLPNKRAIVAGIARPIIVMPHGRQVIDEDRLLEDFRAMVGAGSITDSALRTLVLNGGLGMGDPQILIESVCGDHLTDLSYMTTVTSGHPALHWDCVRDGMDDHLKFGIDLGSVVRNLAAAPVSDAVAADLQAKAAAAVLEIDSRRARTSRDNT